MRQIHFAAAAALFLSACDATVLPVSATLPAAAPVAAMSGQVTWREHTPLGARRSDGLACELAGLNLQPFATDLEIEAARQVVPGAERDARRDACMVQRGYSITQERVCGPADLQGQTILYGRDIDFLPPLSAIRCFVPSQGGFVLA